MAYLTLAEYKARSRITSSDSTDDALIEALIAAAERWIDDYCMVEPGWFAADGRNATARYLAGSGGVVQWIPECISITSVATSSDGITYTAWARDDYDVSDGTVYDRTPYRLLRVRPDGAHAAFPSGQRAVQITAVWGYSVIPPEAVREATAILARTMYLMRDNGTDTDRTVITASGLVIPAAGIPQTVIYLLAPYRRTW